MEVNILQDSTNRRVRSTELIDELLDKAKLNKEELEPFVQHIYLGNSVTLNEEYKLLELDEEKLNYLIEGNSLVIRGDESDNAVCCTQNSTFSFKVAEISNPLLISSDLILSGKTDETKALNSEIVFMTNSYFIMAKEKPKVQKIKNLLELNLYSGKAYEQNEAKKFTMNDFLDQIQSSEDEIYSYLNFIKAFQIDGFWRLLDFKYLNQILDNVLKIIDEKCWLMDKIPVKEIYTELDSIYDMYLIFLFKVRKRNEPNFYSIKKESIMHFYAEAILRATLKMRYCEFQLILQKSLPNNFDLEFNLNLIQDLCYIEEPYIYYLNVQDMPDDLDKRFKYLFEKRKKWSQDELKAFIQDLCSNNPTEISTALTKHCRSYNQNGIKYFTSRI
ncbi:unnamed protein product [Brachionus calyciflorus]|uniref:Sister chromatid cohesion protein DCC1 n=1 Tax=Brachionus calyciflorus TaxID=104777 RepID=A0A813WSD8_9BILA|nr:unnamed protein product [Brachionus calyciflorus]